MTRRSVHLVGSIPVDSTEEAMDLALERLDGRLRTLPDGETGQRSDWIIHIIESFRRHPDMELAKPGDWTDYKRIPRFRVRRGHRLAGNSLDFGHVADFEESWPAFQQRRSTAERAASADGERLAYQQGIPGDFDLALFTLGPLAALRWRRAFAHATLREIREIHARAGGDVVFQIEIPAELVFVASAPRLLQPRVARLLAKGLVRLVAQSPEGARFGIHLCVGDMNNRALGRLKRDCSALVHLANAIVDAWPHGRRLDFIHAPFAAGADPAPVEERFYEPLRRLRLSPETRFIAGFVHEHQSLEDQRRILEMVERMLGRRVDLAAACGLGRRTREAGLRNIEVSAALADT